MNRRRRTGIPQPAAAIRALGSTLALILATAILSPAYGDDPWCSDPEGNCSTPCPTETCHTDQDCDSGFSCVPMGTVPNMPCWPSQCSCDFDGIWYCTADCGQACIADEVLLPATTPWGVALLVLLLLSAGTGMILIRRKAS